MRSSSRSRLGRRGETLAAWLYRLQGFSILGRNVVEYGVEIDLIARRGRTMAFVEVKTRSSLQGGEPWEGIGERQRERLFMAGEQYLRRTRIEATARFDVVSVVWTGLIPNVTIYRNAFLYISDPERPWKRRIVANRS